MSYNQNALPRGFHLKGKSYTYYIEDVLGQGSFGITYLATTRIKVKGDLGYLESTMKVAIKEFFMQEINGRKDGSVTSGSQSTIYNHYRRKFAREANNLSTLNHNNIVKVLEAFEANNTVYYAMEYCAGGSMDTVIDRYNGIKEKEALAYFKQVADALTYMHNRNILHLDIKPSNIMLRSNGDVVLIDFGLSKQYDDSGRPESSTTIGGGTQGYAPIEQSYYREGNKIARTLDVYALGATLYKMLSGKRPPIASDILNEGFPIEGLQAKQISPQTILCIQKAMASAKKDRYQSVADFEAALNGEDQTIKQEEDKQPESEDTVKKHKKQQPEEEKTEYYNYKQTQSNADNRPGRWFNIVVFISTAIIAFGVIKLLTNKKLVNAPVSTEVDSIPAKIDSAITVIEQPVQENTPKETAYKQPVKTQKTTKQQDNQLSSEKYYQQGVEAERESNYEEAFELYRRAAEEGSKEAQYNLGVCYSKGIGVTPDKAESVKWYRKAAEQGQVNAQWNLGMCYDNGRGVTQDKAEAVKWYDRAAEQGYGSNSELCYLASCYYYGKGVAKNYEKAVKWYRKAAEKGYAEAQYNLGECYYYGKGVSQNYNEAVKWYLKAAEQGDATAQYNLGVCYSNGLGVAQNKAEAVKWYLKAAEQGFANAPWNLAVCYYEGDGVPQNYTEAVKWFRKAAEQGDAEAQYQLGFCYDNGRGVSQSKSEASRWYRMAAQQGYDAARQRLNELGESF